MTSNAQHNFAAIQLQLQTLQFENSALTKDVCLKENYIQLKDQQFRVMQKRLEELEAAVAAWKDKYQQQLNVALAAAAGGSGGANPNDDDHDVTTATTTTTKDESATAAPWVAWKTKLSPASTAARSRNVQQALTLMERLSLDDRDKLRPMLAAITNSDGFADALAETQWEEVFADVSEELSKILLLYLLPVLLENHREHAPGSTIHCYSRTYTKQTMDFRILCLPSGGDATVAAAASSGASATAAAAAASTPVTASSVPSTSPGALSVLLGSEPQDAAAAAAAARDARPPSYVRSLSSSANTLQFPLGSPTSEFSSALRSAAEAGEGAAEPVHLFDCADADHGLKRSAAPPVPHGPRELHATKAVYVSKPIAPAGAASGSSSSSAMASRRYSLTPSRASTMLSSDTSRTSTMTSLSSPFTNGSGMSLVDLGDSGDRRSGASSVASSGAQSKDGKIKKVLGSVMDRLNRHKPQPTTTNPSLEDGEAVCDGCGRGPLVGTKWICRTCRVMDDKEFELCDKCYGQGIHGKENEDALFTRIEEIVVSKCSKLAAERELMKLLRVGICKANLKKFSFCLTWIADLLQCKQTKDLRARALEISQIAPHVRSEFVRLLTDLLARYRKDIELITEWQPVQASSAAAAALAAATVVGDDGKGGVAALQLDTLRIWVKDSAESSSSSGAS